MEMQASRSNIASTRRTIPRPWLNKNREAEKVKNASLDILDKPTWTVSWSKLSSCFCIREQTDDGRHNGFRDTSLFPIFPSVRRNSSASLSSSPDLEDVSGRQADTLEYIVGCKQRKFVFLIQMFVSFFVSLRPDLFQALRQVTTRLLHHSLLWVKHTFNLQPPGCHLHDRGRPRQSRLRHLLLRLGNLR
jgi:hypothetical protein